MLSYYIVYAWKNTRILCRLLPIEVYLVVTNNLTILSHLYIIVLIIILDFVKYYLSSMLLMYFGKKKVEGLDNEPCPASLTQTVTMYGPEIFPSNGVIPILIEDVAPACVVFVSHTDDMANLHSPVSIVCY